LWKNISEKSVTVFTLGKDLINVAIVEKSFIVGSRIHTWERPCKRSHCGENNNVKKTHMINHTGEDPL